MLIFCTHFLVLTGWSASELEMLAVYGSVAGAGVAVGLQVAFAVGRFGGGGGRLGTNTSTSAASSSSWLGWVAPGSIATP